MKKYSIPFFAFVLFSLLYFTRPSEQINHVASEELVDQTKVTTTKIPLKVAEKKNREVEKREHPKTTPINQKGFPEDVIARDKPANKAMEILENATLNILESKIIEPQNENEPTTRLSLIETNLKYSRMVVTEKGHFFNETNEVIDQVEAQVASHFILRVKPNISQEEFKTQLARMGCSLKEEISKDTFIVSLNNSLSL